MKRELAAIVCVGVLGAAVLTSGCGMKKASAAQPEAVTATPVPATPTPAPTPTPVPLKTIGTESEDGYKVQLKNLTGKGITGVAVKAQEDTQYIENLLKNEDVFAINEERIFYYTPAEEDLPEQEEGEKLLVPGFDVLLSFDDGSTLELHGFPFEDVAKADVYALDGVAYLVYESVATKSEVNTKAAELEIYQAAQAAQEAADQTETETYEDTTQYQEPDYSYTDYGYTDYGYTDYGYTDYGYTDYGYTDYGYGYTDPGYVDYGTGGNGEEGCLNNGLVY